MSTQAHDGYVGIFDDLKRFARDTVFHLKLQQELAAYRATVECLNFKSDARRLCLGTIPDTGGSEAISGVAPRISARQARRAACAAVDQSAEAADLRRLRRSAGLGVTLRKGRRPPYGSLATALLGCPA